MEKAGSFSHSSASDPVAWQPRQTGDFWGSDPGCYLTDEEIQRAGQEAVVVNH